MSSLVSVDHTTYENISIITLNRPAAANVLSDDLLTELQQVIQQIARNNTTFCTVITATGEKAFCAGADLKERRSMSEHEALQSVRKIGQTMTMVEQLPMPVICALNGVAFGGGLELALACDLRIAADHVSLGLTETSLAIIPGAGGTQRLPRLIGIGAAKKLIYTSKRLQAEEAKQYGIVEKVVSTKDLMKKAISLAKQIIKNGPIALQAAKRAINQGMQVDLTTGLEIEHLHYKDTLHTEDRLEGLQAFAEKRQPIYRGK